MLWIKIRTCVFVCYVISQGRFQVCYCCGFVAGAGFKHTETIGTSVNGGLYLLLFCVFQVNGQDLSKSSHEEAVEAFRTAQEPIVVEVLRRVNKNKMKNRSPTMVSIGTQTEEEIYGFNRPPTPPPPVFPFPTSG